MSTSLVLAPKTTAVLFMDFQGGTLARIADQSEALLGRAAAVLESARSAGALVGHVRVAFRPGYPEISPKNVAFAQLKASGMLLADAPESQIVSALAPRVDEPVFVKRRVGPFSTTDIEAVLRAGGIGKLVLLGFSTSGVVLSTVRHAADADYEIVVVKDGCADQDEEVHRVLMDKVFPRQATVTTAQEVIAALGANAQGTNLGNASARSLDP